MTLVAMWWHGILQRSDGQFCKWENLQKMLASLWENGIIMGAEITRDFLCLFEDIKEQNPTVAGTGNSPKKLSRVFQPTVGFCR